MMYGVDEAINPPHDDLRAPKRGELRSRQRKIVERMGGNEKGGGIENSGNLRLPVKVDGSLSGNRCPASAIPIAGLP